MIMIYSVIILCFQELLKKIKKNGDDFSCVTGVTGVNGYEVLTQEIKLYTSFEIGNAVNVEQKFPKKQHIVYSVDHQTN